MQLNKCKNRCPTPLPGKLFTFPTFSDTDDLDSATCDELSLSETESSTSCRLLPDDTNFLPFQDHTRHLPRPSCIPVPVKQLIMTCSTQSKQNKDPVTIPKAKPSCIPVPNDKKCKDSHLNKPKEPLSSSNPTTLSNQIAMKTANAEQNSSHHTLPADKEITSTANTTCINRTNSYS